MPITKKSASELANESVMTDLSDSVNVATSASSITPIISAAAVLALRRGSRRMLLAASLPSMRNTRVRNALSPYASGTSTCAASRVTPSTSSTAPTPT